MKDMEGDQELYKRKNKELTSVINQLGTSDFEVN